MSKKSRERKQKYLAHEQTQEPPPTTGESRKVFSPLTRVRKCEVPDDGFIHPLERFEPVPPEEMFDQVPSAPLPPAPAEPSQIIKLVDDPNVPGIYYKRSTFANPPAEKKLHDFSNLVEDTPTINGGKMIMQHLTDMHNAMMPRTPDGTLLRNMSVVEIKRAQIPVIEQPTNPSRENPIRPLIHASEFANGKTPDGYHLVDGYVECRQGPDGNPIQITTFDDPARNLSPQDRADLELGRRTRRSSTQDAVPNFVPKYVEAPDFEKNAVEQPTEVGTVIDSPAKGCLIVSTSKGTCRLTNFRIIPLESRMILGKLEREEPRLEYTFEVRCGVMRQTITVGATELDSIVKVVQSKMPICTVTPTVLKATALISNYVREQIMDLPQKIYVQRTGFMRFSGAWVYVHDGAVPPDSSIVFNTGRFIPDDRRVTDVQAFRNAMEFLDICVKDELIIPLFLLAHLGVLFQLFKAAGKTPRFVTILAGRSGSLKTSMSVTLFRQFHDQGQTPTASFRDTETALEIKLGELNSSTGIFDDFAPPVADHFRSKATREKLETIIRYVGDHVAKSRSNTQLGKAKEFVPSGVALVTAEDTSGTQSSLLRCLVLSIAKGDIDGAKLRRYQNSPNMITTHMSRFINWVGLHGDRIVEMIHEEYHTHKFDRIVTELRLIDTAETLLMTARIIATYGIECGAMDYSSAQNFYQRCYNALCTAITASEAMSKEANPCTMYLAAFFDLCERGEIKLASDITLYNGELHDGFLCADCAWVDPHSTYAKVRHYHSKLNTIFPLSEKQLNTHLADAELIEVSYENRDSGTKKLYTKKSSLPNRKRMMVIDIERAQAYMEENSNN